MNIQTLFDYSNLIQTYRVFYLTEIEVNISVSKLQIDMQCAGAVQKLGKHQENKNSFTSI